MKAGVLLFTCIQRYIQSITAIKCTNQCNSPPHYDLRASPGSRLLGPHHNIPGLLLFCLLFVRTLLEFGGFSTPKFRYTLCRPWESTRRPLRQKETSYRPQIDAPAVQQHDLSAAGSWGICAPQNISTLTLRGLSTHSNALLLTVGPKHSPVPTRLCLRCPRTRRASCPAASGCAPRSCRR